MGKCSHFGRLSFLRLEKTESLDWSLVDLFIEATAFLALPLIPVKTALVAAQEHLVATQNLHTGDHLFLILEDKMARLL
jgi:hypothetical protein